MILSTITVVSLLASPFQASADQSNIAVYLDGKNMKFDSAPQLVNGSTLVPMRAIFENLGATVKWDTLTNSVTASKDGTTIKLTIGNKVAYKNGELFYLSIAPTVINQSTYVPLRFISEALDTDVGWINKPNTVTINTTNLHAFKISHIRDGDTFEGTYLDGPYKDQDKVIRLIGVDTPETVKEGTPVQYWGAEASNYTKEMLTGKTVYITGDKSDDPYGRTLAYVFLEDGTFYNANLVSGGYARVLTIEPNTRWKDLFSYIETDAKLNQRGLWSKEFNTSSDSFDPMLQEYLEKKASEFGLSDGKFNPEALVTEQELLKFILIALFPESKAVFLAKSFYDLSQDEQFQQILKYAIDTGLIGIDELSNSEDPLTISSAINIVSRSLDLEQISNDVSPSDFGIYLDQTNSNALLTMEDAILLVEKAERVYGPIKDYFNHLASSVKNSETIEMLSNTLADQKIGEKLRTYAGNVRGIATDPELLESVKIIGGELLTSITSFLSNGWKDLITLTKINGAIGETQKSLTDAEEALEIAKSIN